MIKPYIKELKKYQNKKNLQLYTDAGLHLKSGRATYGIIIGDDTEITEIKYRMLDIEPGGATTAEGLSIAIGLNMMKKPDYRGQI